MPSTDFYKGGSLCVCQGRELSVSLVTALRPDTFRFTEPGLKASAWHYAPTNNSDALRLSQGSYTAVGDISHTDDAGNPSGDNSQQPRGVTLSSDPFARWTDGPTSRPAFYAHRVFGFQAHIWCVPPDSPIQRGPLEPNILSEQDTRAAVSGLFSESSSEASSMQLHNHFDDDAAPSARY